MTTATKNPTRPQRVSPARSVGNWMMNNGALVGLIVLIIALALATPHFLTAGNLVNVGLNWVLVYGHVGLPAMGAVGATSRALAGCSAWFCAACDWFCDVDGWVICWVCAQAGAAASSARAVAAVKT